MINETTNDPIFLVYYLSSIRWFISILDFKTFQIQFHELSLLFLEIQSSPPVCVIFWCENSHIQAKNDTFKSVKKDTHFLKERC